MAVSSEPVRAGRAGEQGQTLVLVVLMITVLLGFVAVAVDMGRFVSERRFLQNAVDAAALAGVNALRSGKNASEAEAAARAQLAQNFANDPTGGAPGQPSTIPVYQDGHVGDPRYLQDGVLIGDGWARVAVRNDVAFTFGRVFGLTDQEVAARAHAGFHIGLLPIAVRQYIQAPGPDPGASAPCPHNERVFMAVFATANTACLGSDTDASPRSEPSYGMNFSSTNPNNDPANHGPIVAILGQGSEPSNAADFRGYFALDIRNFATSTSQVFYNGVTADMNENQVKDVEARWILDMSYPGPGFPIPQQPPHADNQAAVLSGNSAGRAVDAMVARYVPGDEIVVAVYPGYVMAIPDFLMSQPPTLQLPETGTVANGGFFRVSRNQAFSGLVTFSTEPDTLDPANPLNLGTMPGSPVITYDPNPLAPSLGSGTNVYMRNITTAGATPGVYALWVKGASGSPYLTAKRVPVPVVVGSVTRDFTMVADASGKVATNAGDTVTFTLTLQNAPNRNTDFGGSVALSVDAPLPGGMSYTMSSSASPSKNGTTVTLQIHTGGMAPGRHEFAVRATGMNGDPTPRSVTHLLQLMVNVAPAIASGNQEYIDLTGFAAMRITQMNSNTILAYALTPVIGDMTDPRLRIGRPPRLLPW